MAIDSRFRAPRRWSNEELEKICSFLRGSVINVSAWMDQDKEGRTYKEHYFRFSEEYFITNWKAEAFGYQGNLENEIFLDLESDLPHDLVGKFDVVFNHTTLEHVFDVQKAFFNLCAMSRDVVIVVVPFLQEQHGLYGDYWRFTPWCIKRLFEKNGMSPAYINANDSASECIYVFGVGVRDNITFQALRKISGNKIDSLESFPLGRRFCERKSLFREVADRFLHRFSP